MAPIACVVCAVDPNMAGLVIPLAQATIVATPILLRKHIAGGVRKVRQRRDDTRVAVLGAKDPAERRGTERQPK